MRHFFALLTMLTIGSFAIAQNNDTRYYELRIYYCFPGRLDALVERFSNHTTRIFEKHGMENVGYWLPINNTENALYYILAYPDKKARDAAWKAFGADPEWKKVSSESEQNGKIVEKVRSVFMTAADISPVIKASAAKTDRSFELRTYHCYPDQLPNLLTRFRNHTLGFFKKYKMTNIGYWTTVEESAAQSKLVYLLAYPSEAAGRKSWEQFRADDKWLKVKETSEKDHPIVEKVESVLLKPLPFSKIK